LRSVATKRRRSALTEGKPSAAGEWYLVIRIFKTPYTKEMKKVRIVLSGILIVLFTSFSTDSKAQEQTYTYAYISIAGRLFSKKLAVQVDFGDTEEQIADGEKFSEFLSEKKSYAAVLNYMVDNKFELVETLDYTYSYEGSGGTSGVVFIMRKMK
jgi:hypothetical protein